MPKYRLFTTAAELPHDDLDAADMLDPIVLAAETAAGDLRDWVLDRLKHDHKPLPWNMRPEQEQRELVGQIEGNARRLVARLVETIVADGKPVLKGTLVKVLVKDGLKAQIDMLMSDPLRHVLIDHQGRTVFVAIADTEKYEGARREVDVKPDQSNMLGDDGFEPAND